MTVAVCRFTAGMMRAVGFDILLPFYYLVPFSLELVKG
jgi:hypothetical protein